MFNNMLKYGPKLCNTYVVSYAKHKILIVVGYFDKKYLLDKGNKS